MTNSLGRKPGRIKTNKAKAAALADVSKPILARLNANIEAKKYLAFQIKAKQNLTDVTALVNQWVDEYLEDE